MCLNLFSPGHLFLKVTYVLLSLLIMLLTIRSKSPCAIFVCYARYAMHAKRCKLCNAHNATQAMICRICFNTYVRPYKLHMPCIPCHACYAICYVMYNFKLQLNIIHFNALRGLVFNNHCLVLIFVFYFCIKQSTNEFISDFGIAQP